MPGNAGHPMFQSAQPCQTAATRKHPHEQGQRGGAAQGGHIVSSAAFHSGASLSESAQSLVSPATPGDFRPLIRLAADTGPAGAPAGRNVLPPACPRTSPRRFRVVCPFATSLDRQVRHPCTSSRRRPAPRFERPERPCHGADGAKLGAGLVDRKGHKRFPRAIHAEGRGLWVGR